MLDKSTILLHYKRKDIQEAMLVTAGDREVSIRYANGGFGRRPDILQYPNDIIEMVKAGATSFHVSEERWSNPLILSPELKKKELEDLRIGWDLVIDIDCPVFEYSRIIAYLIVKALRRYGIKSISCKFSGNKGFHIAIPFESFPEKVSIKGDMKDIRLLFPEGLRRILNFLGKQIDSKERGYELTSMILKTDTIDEISRKMGKSPEDMFRTVCRKCENPIVKKYRNFDIKIICPYCNKENIFPPEEKEKYITCSKCRKIIKNEEVDEETACLKCGSKDFFEKFDNTSILELDSVLISSRHLYRMVYSLHEKSGLSSVPVDIDTILEFKRAHANPKGLEVSGIKFLDTSGCIPGEAGKIIQEAFDDEPLIEVENIDFSREYKIPQSAVPEDFFPPCIKKILSGGMKDGKKRALFSLTNFLGCLGWDYDSTKQLVNEWNNRLEEPLREVYIKGQLNSHKQKKKPMLPHNCRSYYEDLQVCFPDSICNKIKNPVNYALVKVWIKNSEDQKKNRSRANENNPNLTEEQKEFIRKNREKEKEFKKMMKEKKAKGDIQ